VKKINSFAACNATLLLLVSFSIFPALAGDLYRWVDNQGNVTYQSSPPPGDAAKVEKSSIRTGNDDAPNVEEAVQPEEKNLEPVTLYSKPECSSCDAAREFFEENEIPFNEIDLSESSTEADELEKKLGYSSAPVIGIGEKYVGGFEPGMLKNLLTNEGYDLPAE
jgi:glutaredoxin-like protein NrdH